MPQLSLFIDTQLKQLVRAFNSSIAATLPPVFQGDTLTLFLRFMNPTGNASVPYADVNESSSFVQVAIGVVGGVPTAGTFTLTDPDATQTTAPIAYNASAATVQAAIAAGLTTNWSTATVTGNAGGPWTIVNGANAERSALVLAGGALVPASQGEVSIQQAGSGSEPAIQYIKIELSPIAYQDSWTAYPAPSIMVANVQTGGVSGSNSIQSVTLCGQPYAGTFTLSFGGQTTAPISYNASPSTVQAALQSLSSVGIGNCSVGGAVGAYQITFIGTLGGAAQAAITGSPAGLIGPLALTGTLSLATVGIEEAVGESPSIEQTLEINITPSGGAPQTVLQIPVSILNDLIPNAPATPTPTPSYLTSAQVYALISSLTAFASESISAAGADTPTIPQYCRIFTYAITAGAGTGAYTHTTQLSSANRVAGDKACVVLSLPASTNPTVEVLNNAGSAIYTAVGTGVATVPPVSKWFTFDTDWALDG